MGHHLFARLFRNIGVLCLGACAAALGGVSKSGGGIRLRLLNTDESVVRKTNVAQPQLLVTGTQSAADFTIHRVAGCGDSPVGISSSTAVTSASGEKALRVSLSLSLSTNQTYEFFIQASGGSCSTTPIVYDFRLSSYSVAGVSVSGSMFPIAKDRRPTLIVSGPFTIGNTVQIYQGGSCSETPLVSKIADTTDVAQGYVHLQVPLLPEGDYVFGAKQIDAYGNESGCRAMTVAHTIRDFHPFTEVTVAGNSFAALRDDGSVETWGAGALPTDLARAQLKSNVVKVFANYNAFAALKADGSLVTWGGSGGDSSSVAASLTSGVVKVGGTDQAFAAIKADGSLVAWGDSGSLTNFSSVSAALSSGVSEVYGNSYAFAALKTDGSVKTWGSNSYGGNSSAVSASLASNVVKIFHTPYAFAAGVSYYGGDSSAVASALSSGVVDIIPGTYAYAALKSDGSVVTWGDSLSGGDSTTVSSQLSSGVVKVVSTDQAFAAIKSDGSVVTWGNIGNGGVSGEVASALSGHVVDISSAGDSFNGSAFVARKVDGSVVSWGPEAGGGTPPFLAP